MCCAGDLPVFMASPSWAEVLEGWAGRVAMVRVFSAPSRRTCWPRRQNPHDSGSPGTVRSCLHVILNEEWQYLRHASRDPDAIDAGQTG